MSKEEILKIQTCTLKVHIHCDGCKRKVKKTLQKIEGVYKVGIDSEQGKVMVSGNVDPPTLIKKLEKSGKHAEIWGAPKANQQMNNQFKNMQIDGGKGGGGSNKNQGQKDGGKGGGGNDKNHQGKGGQPQQKGGGFGGLTPQQLQQLQQLKEFQDLKLPPQFKDMKLPSFGGGGGGGGGGDGKGGQKSVKFKLPESDESDGDYDDDEFDDDDYDYDDNEFDDDIDDMPMKKPVMGGGGGFQMADMKNPQFMKGGQMPPQMMKGLPQGGNDGKKGGGGNIPAQVNGGAKKGGGGGGDGNQNYGGGGKNGGGQNKNGGGDGGGGQSQNKNGGGNFNANGVHGMPNIMGMNGGGGSMGPMDHMTTFKGLPAGNPMHGGGNAGSNGNAGGNAYFKGAGPEAMAGNAYYQQQLAAMMNQQRANGNERFQPMMYARPPPAVNYMPPPYPPYPYPQPPVADPLTHYFSDENTSSCNVM